MTTASLDQDEYPSAVEVRDLYAGYGTGDVLHGVSLAAKAGAVTALLGPNGAGKTSLLRCISGLLEPSAGEVLLAGSVVTTETPERRTRRGLLHITEGRGIYRSLTVRENLVVQSRRGKEADAIAMAAQAFPVLGGRLGQIAGTMSGGEQQMLALAAAYVRSPSTIIVDEPSLGLAPLIVDAVFEYLQTLCSAGVSLLLVDQFAHRVLDMADAAYVLARGQMVYQGSADDLAAGDLFEYYVGAPTE